jgi:hypothetical protein
MSYLSGWRSRVQMLVLLVGAIAAMADCASLASGTRSGAQHGVDGRQIPPSFAEPSPISSRRIDLHFPTPENSEVVVTIIRDAGPRIENLTVSSGEKQYQIDGGELRFLTRPLVSDIMIGVEDVKGVSGITLTIPYFESDVADTGSPPKVAYIIIRNMNQHSIIR